MRATSIIKVIDDLGRVEIPREIRRRFEFHGGQPLEIYLDKTADGHPMVCFAKYSPTFENDFTSLTTQITNNMDDCGEHDLSDKFRDAIKEAVKILKEFEKGVDKTSKM